MKILCRYILHISRLLIIFFSISFISNCSSVLSSDDASQSEESTPESSEAERSVQKAFKAKDVEEMQKSLANLSMKVQKLEKEVFTLKNKVKELELKSPTKQKSNSSSSLDD